MEEEKEVTPDEILNTPYTRWEMIRSTITGIFVSLPFLLQFIVLLGLFLIGWYACGFLSEFLGIGVWGFILAIIFANVWVWYKLSKNRHRILGTKHSPSSTLTKGYFD